MKKLLIILSILILSSCQFLNEREANIISDRINVCGSAPSISPVVMREVKFYIIKDEHGISYVSMLPKHYENISLNMQSILAHIEQQKAITKFYKSCLKLGEEKDGG